MVRGIPSISSFGFSIFLTTMSNVGEEFLCRATATRSVFAPGLRGDVQVKSRRNDQQNQLAVNKENVMKAGITRLIMVAATAAVVVFVGSTAAWAQAPTCPASFTTPSYSPDFSNAADQACLTLNGNYDGSSNSSYPAFTSPAGPPAASAPAGVLKVLRLTPAYGTWATSAWFNTAQPISSGFSTTFLFQISDTSGYNADGFAFLVQNSALAALANPGCAVGFGEDYTYGSCALASGGIPNSLAVEFKTFDDGYPSPYPNTANSVSIMSGANGGTPTGANCIDTSCAISANNSLQVAGTVSTTGGTMVTWMSGSLFSTSWAAGTTILINGAPYTIASVASPTSLTVTMAPPELASAPYSFGAPVAGKVTTTGTNTVTWASGSYFNPAWDVGTQILINGVAYTITSGPTGETATTATTLTVTPDPPAFAAAPYSVGIILDDGNVHTATITYTPTPTASASPNCIVEGSPEPCIDVILDGVDLFNGGVLFNMTNIGLASGTNAWVGFTGGNAGGNDDEDILSWTFAPQAQSQTATVTPTAPATYNYNGGCNYNGSGCTGTGQTVAISENPASTKTINNLVLTAIPIISGNGSSASANQLACNAIVQANPAFVNVGPLRQTAECFVYLNGGGPGIDAPVMLAITCPPSGICDTPSAQFYAAIAAYFDFTCAENLPLSAPTCTPYTPPSSFGFPNLTSTTGYPAIGVLQGAGSDPNNPCSLGTNLPPLFTSNQIVSFVLGDGNPGSTPVKSGSGGLTSCLVATYDTPNEIPTAAVTSINGSSPVNGANYPQGSTVPANYTCTAISTDPDSILDPNGYPAAGPYLTVSTCTATSGLTAGGGTPTTSSCSPSSPTLNTCSGTFNIDTSETGPHTLTVAVEDSATNTASSTVTYYVLGHASGLNGKNCNGFYTGTYNGNLTVSSGQSCTFTNGGITGNLTQTGGTVVLENSSFVKGSLQASSGILSISSSSSVSGNLQITGGNLSISNSSVSGNLQITGGGTFSIGPTVSIGGNLQIQNLPASAGTNQICGDSVLGNLTVQQSGTATLIGSTSGCAGNMVDGNLEVESNTAATKIYYNTVKGNLEVLSNTAATAIYNNTVNGNLEDQNNTAATQVFTNAVTADLECSGNSSITGGGNKAKRKQGQCTTF